MDFFKKQELAKRKSFVLVVYFLLAVTAMVIVLNVAAYLAFQYASQSQHASITKEDWLNGPFWWIGLSVVGMVLAGSLWRFQQLREGGSRLATMLGASPVDMNSPQPQYRQLINITEEMSIASGIPMPRIFILNQEQGINAFVAGYNLEDMTLTLSLGALEQLNRDELQGVIAHEFSHIQNADTRLNMKIISFLAGILLIGSIGGFLCRSASFRRHGHYHRSRSKNSGGIFIIGAVLFIVGYTGLFFGRLIQAAISRQREWLADATAVQFTRNPSGIAGALGKIADLSQHSYLQATANAQEVNHMCFSESLKLRDWLASHPPLNERIKAVDPMFLTRQRAARNAEKVKSHRQQPASPVHTQSSGFTAGGTENIAAFSAQPVNTATVSAFAGTASGVTASPMKAPDKSIIGTTPVQNYAASHKLVNQFNLLFGADLHRADYTEVLLYALVLKQSPPHIRSTVDVWHSSGQRLKNMGELPETEQKLKTTDQNTLLSLLEVIIGVLKPLSQPTKSKILEQVKIIVDADQRTSFTEFIIQTFVNKHLGAKVQNKPINSISQAKPYLEIVISMFARLGLEGQEISHAKALFDDISGLHYPLTRLQFRPKISGGLMEIAVTRLSHLNIHLKPSLIEACMDCIAKDGQVTDKEYQLLRITVEMLDCPMPPLFTR